VIDNLEITAPIPGNAMRAAYFELTNTTNTPLAITQVSSPNFGVVAMHETIIEDGIARMRFLDQIALRPGQTVTFARGSKHLMLSRPSGPTNPVVLQFFAKDALLLSVSTRTAIEN
jgi:copper(I)-binding protein